MATKRNRDKPDNIHQEIETMMMPKGKPGNIPKLSQSHIRFPKSPSEKSPGDNESGDIPGSGSVEFRNLFELAAAECELLWHIPSDPRAFHNHPTVIEPIHVGSNSLAQEDRIQVIPVPSQGEHQSTPTARRAG